MLMTPGTETNVPGVVYQPIPPMMFANYETNSIPGSDLVTNSAGQVFVNLVVSNGNQLAVGWLERYGRTNLFNTLAQSLITYSIAHDDLFPNSSQPNGVIVGGYGFQLSPGAVNGQQYQIQINRASATSDGVGAPGDGVDIFAGANTNDGALGPGTLNAVKNVTVGTIPYLVGNVYPFRWFNAGDFGNSNLQSADVEQVFQTAVYAWNSPPRYSDFYDAMNSCGGLGYLDQDPGSPFYGYYTNAGPLSASQQMALLGGDITNINQMAFGDTNALDVSDVYVTFLRSEFTNQLIWFQRMWTNGVRVATASYAPGIVPALLKSGSSGKTLPAIGSGSVAAPISITNTPSVNFTAGDYQGAAGQQISIPVTASVFGPYPLRMLMLNISVVPLDGSPALTTPISFNLNPPFNNSAYYNPTGSGLVDSAGNGNYALALLPLQFPIPQSLGVSNNAVVGNLIVTIPANATSQSAYAIHFDHASGSPNGFASFNRHTLTGLITLSSRTNSYYNDGIPDSWRLRYFGTVYNYLSVSNADADGTGMNNWQKYVAGLDPLDPTAKLIAGTDQPMAQGSQDSVVYWPSVSGKTYIIQRSATLFPAVWNNVSTNIGTGGYMEIHDPSGGAFRYYRVTVQ